MPSVPIAREPNGGSADSGSDQRERVEQKGPGTNGHSQQPPNEGVGRGKKKANLQLKGKGIGAVVKGRSPAPGWTGAGFDVDGGT